MSDTSKKRGISIYKGTDVRPNGESGIWELTEEQMRPLWATLDAFELGSKNTELVRDAGGFHLLHIWWKPNFPLPRHSHNADCMYYVVSGSLSMGNRTLRAGDSFYTPADAPYQYVVGPEGAEILEIRKDVEKLDMTWFGDTDAYDKTVHRVMEENREVWENATVSPTFAANAAESVGR